MKASRPSRKRIRPTTSRLLAVPTLILQGDDDQVVPYKDASLLQAKLVRARHTEDLSGLPARHAGDPPGGLNRDMLTFLKA